MIGKANGVLDNTNRLTANLASLDVQGTLNKVNQTLESAHQFTEKPEAQQPGGQPRIADERYQTVRQSDVNHGVMPDSLGYRLEGTSETLCPFLCFRQKRQE